MNNRFFTVYCKERNSTCFNAIFKNVLIDCCFTATHSVCTFYCKKVKRKAINNCKYFFYLI